ncbi:MAG: hypothetical protein IPL52_11565 [Flavobacteriales bacterium]|nr:hypothetical protein [Flavobacteriales bacterium]
MTGRHRSEGQTIVAPKGIAPDAHRPARDGERWQHPRFHIPNTWFVKDTKAQVLPRWIGFDDTRRDYTAHVDVPTGIAQVTIDPTNRLADAYKLNDHLHMPLELTFDHHIWNQPDRRTYEAFVRPDLWWNGYDGVKAASTPTAATYATSTASA